MNPWPYLALAALGMLGMVAGAPDWWKELNKIVDQEEYTGRASTLRERMRLTLRALVVILFSLVALFGIGGLMVWQINRF
jgi:hypothetical protein